MLSGGLGNQMFQYAMYLSLKRNGINTRIDISLFRHVKMHNGYELRRVFGIDEKPIDKTGIHLLWLRLLKKIKPTLLYSRDTLHFDPNTLFNKKKYIDGYWQSELYFKNIDSTIRNVFQFQNIDLRNINIAKAMSNCESVSLHIRRGDYTTFGMPIIGEDYYIKAVNLLLSRLDNAIFYIFSDDCFEAKRIADDLKINYYIISHNKGEDSYKDMYLMSKCKHNIIANSSFSWWGAWLNSNPNKIVIAPKWLYDFNCKTWIEI